MLERARRESRPLDLAPHATPELAQLTPRDRGLAFELISGTLKRQNTLDALLAGFAEQPLKRIDPRVLVALRLSSFQLLYLDRVPAHAAVDEGVELAKRRSRKAGGFVNAVLRRVAADGRERLAALTTGDDEHSLALRFSHPDWLVGLWRAELGDALAFAVMGADNAPAPRCVRVNVAKAGIGDALASLAEGGATATPVDAVPGALLVDGAAIESSVAFREGLVTPQSAGSQLAAIVAGDGLGGGGAEVGEPVRLADLCAAPGAKTTQLAAAHPRAEVVAVEVDAARADQVRANLDRLGVANVDIVVGDVLRLPPELDGAFDAVLLDPPCSGLGTLASRPDLRWRHRPTEIARLADRQRRLLVRAAGLVKPGGALTYSVCTLTEAESVDVVRHLLESGGWLLDDLGSAYPRFAHPRHGGYLLTLPSRDHTSGFFIARLRRQGRRPAGANREP